MTWLLGDIGGTNARFALLGEDGALCAVERFAVAGHPTAEAALRAYLALHGGAPEAAILAVAATVEDGRARLTNAQWEFEERSLAQALGLRRVVLINDFAALAQAVPRLGERQLLTLGGGPGRPDAPIAVLGPGTGLGCATLLPDGRVLVGEGGHVTLAAVDEREAALLAILRRRFAHVSAERVLSGPGLIELHEAVGELDGSRAPRARDGAEVAAAASAGCPGAEATLAAFFGFLGTVAGNLALTVGAKGGLYLAGGILPRLAGPLRGSVFRERFQAKGRFRDYLAAVPLRLIVEPDPAFLGLIQIAEQQRHRAADGRRA
ncbi:MAG: glucokinase [Tistlia sp.]|uniref:glucokinase n=1 Tax=Tistlia sp. TaxID=3057121 RepID=UPI0034A16650